MHLKLHKLLVSVLNNCSLLRTSMSFGMLVPRYNDALYSIAAVDN